MSYLDNIGLGTLWSRIMTALGVKEDKATIVNHGTSDTTFALTPNVLHTWGTVNSLTLSLASGSSTYVDGYWFKFTAGSSFTDLTMPSGVNWVTEPEIEAGKTYEVMIVDGLASYLTDGIDSGFATQEWVQSHTQAPLVNGTNIKTINNESLLGSGNITISGGGSGDVNIIEAVKVNGVSLTPDANKAVDVTVPIESTVAGWGFTKNTGTYSKPSGGIPASDLAAGVIPTVPTNVSAFTNDAGYVTDTSTVTIYSGSTAPSSSLGNDGDIYIQVS